MEERMLRLRSAILVASVTFGCGGDVGDGSALEPSKALSELDDVEIGEFCDWSAARMGGYGFEQMCAGSTTVRVHRSREDCVASTRRGAAEPACTATVADFESCLDALGGDACRIVTESECAFLLTCATPSE